ncbi:small heat shock protein [Crepidotus variabilis]|uniref:Small heat shock protein n=1 Tax=Crepidotus variabilis TaxID=179855 RepID=A0A9P6EK14_9AGAR|nr:small heat shock protein [Crepidotus variabilis]
MSTFYYYEPSHALEQIFDAFLPGKNTGNGHRGGNSGVVRSLRPRLDLQENQENNLVTAIFEFPGVSKEDIQIDVQHGKLTVSTETKQVTEGEEKGYVVRERRFGKFSRTLQLPEGVNEEEIKASMENGLLTITFPRSAPELAPKRVAIA